MIALAPGVGEGGMCGCVGTRPGHVACEAVNDREVYARGNCGYDSRARIVVGKLQELFFTDALTLFSSRSL